jgi:hypothetical protein
LRRDRDGLLDIAVLGTRTPVDWLRLAAQVLLRRRRRGPDQHGQARSSGSPRLRLETFRARHMPPRMRRAFSQAGYHLVTAEQVERLLAQARFTQVRTEVKPGSQEPEGFCTLGGRRS